MRSLNDLALRCLLFLLTFISLSHAVPLKSQDPDQAIPLIESIAHDKKTDPKLLAQLIDAVGDPGTNIRIKERAAWAIGRLNAKSGVTVLVEAAHHKGLLVRSAALDSLSHMRSWSGIPVYKEIAEHDPVLSMRQRATLALGLTGSDKVIKEVVKLSSDGAPEVRGAAALAMGALQSKKNDFGEALQEMVSDNDPSVRDRAQKALDVAHRKTAAVRDHLSSGESDIRLFAALYFRSHGTAKDVNLLKAAANADSDEEVRYELGGAVKSIQRHSKTSATPKKKH